ncbi:MAG: endo-1,4-beta-xylanase [Fimbriimonadaceae bacterium]|jgi:GH35 family endo-1,4-beta-xylanase|nr:endo-1,4-beta-xylanase [Fimbriimonadaceae bacterium]
MIITTLLASLVVAQASSPTNLLVNGDFGSTAGGWDFPSQTKRISTPHGPGVSISVEGRGGNTWDVQFRQLLAQPVKRGDVFSLRFFARSQDRVKIEAFVQEYEGRWQTLGSLGPTLTPDWQEYSVIASANLNYPERGVQVTFTLNHAPGTVELANVRLSSLSANRPTRQNPTTLLGALPSPEAWRLRSAQVASTGQGIRITANPNPDARPWEHNVQIPLNGVILPGDTLVFRAKMRSANRSRVTANIELNAEPHTKVLSESVVLTPEWRDVILAGPASSGWDATQGQFTLFLGHGKTDVEVENIQIQNFGRTPPRELGIKVDPYGGQANPETWRAPALARIERIRKGDITIIVQDRNGRPVPNATIQVEQQKHHFRFGTAVVGDLINGTSEDAAQYRANLKRLFNTAVFENDMKWGNPGNDTPEGLAKTRRALDWLEQQGFRTRGHNLVWGSDQYLPGNLKSLTLEQKRQAVRDRVKTGANLFKGRLYAWDVVNEAVTENSLWQALGWSEFRMAYQLAKETDPKALTVYNDFNVTEESQAGKGHQQAFFRLVREQLAAGAKIDMLGLQGHVGTPLTPTQRVLEILDETAQFKLPIEITEYDVTLWDDTAHAAHTRDFVTACFSHPSVEAVILWGFWAGAHWRGDTAALFNLDWSPRPAAKVWEDMVKREWWTKASLRSNSAGQASTRAFYGTHKVTIRRGSATATATIETKPGQPARVVVKLP